MYVGFIAEGENFKITMLVDSIGVSGGFETHNKINLLALFVFCRLRLSNGSGTIDTFAVA